MMEKDEIDLIEPWLAYHSNLFSKKDIFIFDNGSKNINHIIKLHQLREDGFNVIFDNYTSNDFRRKGEIFGEKIKKFDIQGDYEFLIPLDCDEFFCVEIDGKPCFDPSKIKEVLHQYVGEKNALSINSSYFNLLGVDNHFWRFDTRDNLQNKTFFAKQSFVWMDHGFHTGRTKTGERVVTPFTFMHFHYRPYAYVGIHSKNKLRPYMDVENEKILADNKNNRLVSQILSSEEEYMKKFNTKDSLYENRGCYIPQFGEYMKSINSKLPFTL